MAIIQDLKKGDKFIFNSETYIVTRKWINDDKPLIAKKDFHLYEEHRFHHEGLVVDKIEK